MDCPNGWTDCDLCAFWSNQYKTCIYVPEEEPAPEPVTELTENELTTDLGVTIPRQTWFEQFSRMTEKERWERYRKYHADDLISKEPYKAMAGAVVPGGGSRAGRLKKSKKGTKIIIEPWTLNS